MAAPSQATGTDPDALSSAPQLAIFTRIDREAKGYRTRCDGGPDWDSVQRRVTIDLGSVKVLEDIVVTPDTPDSLLHRNFEDGITRDICTQLHYTPTGGREVQEVVAYSKPNRRTGTRKRTAVGRKSMGGKHLQIGTLMALLRNVWSYVSPPVSCTPLLPAAFSPSKGGGFFRDCAPRQLCFARLH